MSETTTVDDMTADDRIAAFDRDVAALGHRPSGRDRLWQRAGLGLMVAGVVLAIVGYSTSTAQSDARDVTSAGILALVGISVVITGAAIYVRSAMTEFLRFWMLRLLFEQQKERGR